MDEEFAWTFLSQRGPTLLHLVSTWEDLLIKEKAAVEVEVVVEEEAVIVIVMTIEVTAVAEDAVTTTEVTAVVEAETDTEVAAGIAADHLPRTIVLNAVVHAPDLTPPAVIDDRNGKKPF